MENNQDKNKILIFSTAYLPLVGGAEIAVKETTDRLPNWHFDLITAKIRRELSDFERIGNINVYRIGFGFNFDKFLLPILGLWKSWRLERKNNYRLTWSIMASYGGFLGLFFKKFHPRKPWLLTLQEGDAPELILKKAGFFKKWFCQIFQKADYIQAISRFLSDWAEKMDAKCPMEIIPNGVDIRKFKRSSETEIGNLKKKLNIKSDEKIILTASRLVYKNAVDDLIKAGQYLKFPFKILIAGAGEEEQKLKKLAKQLNLNDRILFLGHIDYNELPQYYSVADVFVRASRSEGFGNVFLEALACGTLPIGTAVDGSAIRILYTEKAGLGLCENPQGMPKEIANQITIAISSNRDKINKMIENGQELIKKEYTWDIIAQKMEKVYLIVANLKKILFLTGIFPPDIGGPAAQIDILARDLVKKNYQVKILTYGKTNKKKHPYQIEKISKKKLFSNFIYFFYALWLAVGSDIVYSWDLYSAGLAGLIIKKILDRKVINRFAGDSAWEKAASKGLINNDDVFVFQDKRYSSRIERWKNRRKRILINSDKIIAVSDFLKKTAIKIGVSEEKIKVIYNSVDIIKKSKKTDVKENVKVEFDFNGDDIILLTAARLVPWKGVDMLIEIMPELIKKYGKIKLVIIGEGPEMRKLKDLRKKLSLENQVIFRNNIVRAELIQYMRIANIFLLNTNYEGMSHTILEAMSVGVPIITTNAGGNPETIINKQTGLMVNYGNKKQWTEIISLLLENPALGQKMISLAKENLKKFNWEKLVKETIDIFENLCPRQS